MVLLARIVGSAANQEQTHRSPRVGDCFSYKPHEQGVDSIMSEKDSGPESGAKGVVEGVKGKVKEAAGALTGKDELKREGEAQQEKAEAQRDVATKEAEAEKARAEAAAREAEQKSHQKLQ
jgi:uncharacterized protein YjbJ (UPF0337 family)